MKQSLHYYHTPFVEGGNKYRYDHTTEQRKLSFADKSFIHGRPNNESMNYS